MLKSIIIDDDIVTLKILEKLISKISYVQILEVFTNTNSAEDFLKNQRVDIIFVDINMPQENGIEFAKRLVDITSESKIVFITSHKEYALEAFEVYAFDYIVKPVSQDRLYQTIQRVKSIKLAETLDVNRKYKLYVHLFGGIDVRDPQGEAVKFPSSKSEELFTYLLLAKGNRSNKWDIIESIFTDMPVSNAETYLNTTVYKLRKFLEKFGLRDSLKNVNKSYVIDTKDIYIDVICFKEKAQNIRSNDENTFEEAMGAEEIYTGELLGSKLYNWALLYKENLSVLYWGFSIDLCVSLIKARKYDEALKIIKKLQIIDPINEDIICLSLKVFAAKDDKNSLEERYHSFKKLLAEELGDEPQASTQAFYEQIKKTL